MQELLFILTKKREEGERKTQQYTRNTKRERT